MTVETYSCIMHAVQSRACVIYALRIAKIEVRMSRREACVVKHDDIKKVL
jgi:hypothetical protein